MAARVMRHGWRAPQQPSTSPKLDAALVVIASIAISVTGAVVVTLALTIR